MDEEKGVYNVTEGPARPETAREQDGRPASSEAAGEYPDARPVDQYGNVTRGLKSRHIQFIALGGTIGTGLFLAIGKAFYLAGPLSVMLGYLFMSFAIWGMMQCIGEMATWLSLPGALPQYCARYVDPAMGFAVGWNNWGSNTLTLCAEIAASSMLIGYWNDTVNEAAWMSLVLIVVLFLNVFAVSIYGEAEFIFASIKIVTIVGLLLLALIIDLGGVPGQPRLGFHYWKGPQWTPMKEYITTGATGRFAGLFSTLVNAAFAFGGVELVIIAAGEAQNPRRNIPKAARRVFWRILLFYILGSLALGVTMPSDDPRLLSAEEGAGHSPWVIAVQGAGIKVLPHIINAVILTSASSAGNAFLYSGSRFLYALAQNKQAPRFLLRCTKRGVPIYCVLITASGGLLTFMTLSSGASEVFQWFQTLTAVTSMFAWLSILVAYIRFYYALKAQGVNRDTDMVFKSPWQPYTAYFSLSWFIMIIIFNGFAVFTKTDGESNWSVQGFFTAYIVGPIYFSLYFFWKIFKRTKLVKAVEADIWSGKAEQDALVWPADNPRNVIERIWFWIA